MEKDRDTRIIGIIALIVGVLCLSLGFTNYTLDYIISNKINAANYIEGPNEFDVTFSTDINNDKKGTIIGQPSGDKETGTAVIDENSVMKLNAKFTAPGQSVSFSFYNINKYNGDAFLNSVVYSNVKGKNSFKECIAEAGTTKEYVDAACESIGISVKAGKDIFYNSRGGIDDHILPKLEYEDVVVTIYYLEDGARADGPFTVNFGDISLIYSITD